MRPQWYRFEDIPYNKMWPDDREWCPIMLKGQKFKAYYLFQGHGKILNAHLEIKGPL